MSGGSYVTWYLISFDKSSSHDTNEFFIAHNPDELDKIVSGIIERYPGMHTQIKIRVDRHAVPSGPIL